MAPSSSGSPASMRFLNSVLSQKGPNSLPYQETLKVTIRSHLANLLEDFTGLGVKTEAFTENDGRASTLLQVHGTIPMYYHEVMYNIPVTIWLLEEYPKKAPRVFVTPTRDMIIKRPHCHVDPSGLVSDAYLQNWHSRSSLVELVRSLCTAFEQDPPLYSKPAGAYASHGTASSQTSLPNRTVTSGMQPRASMSSTAATGMCSPSTASPIPSTSSYGRTSSALSPHRSYSPYGHPASLRQQASARTDLPSEVFRRNAINALTERVQRDVAEMRKAGGAEIDKLANVQGSLKQRHEKCKKGLQGLFQEKEALEQQLQIVLTNTDVLEIWLEKYKKGDDRIDIDTAFEPYDALSKQLLECTSYDLAMEDAFYYLEKAVHEGVVPVDVYLKRIRTFSREQFVFRATAVKVRAAQAQLHVAAMAGRAMPVGV